MMHCYLLYAALIVKLIFNKTNSTLDPILIQLQNQGVVGNINYQLVEPTIPNAPIRWR